MIYAYLLAYGLGWLAAIPGALRRYMLCPRCPRCLELGSGSADCFLWREHSEWKKGKGTVSRIVVTERHLPPVPRGSVTDRDGWALSAAAVLALAWPLRLAWAIVSKTIRFTGGTLTRIGLAATRLTGPELERLNRQRAEEIDRLTKEIGR